MDNVTLWQHMYCETRAGLGLDAWEVNESIETPQ